MVATYPHKSGDWFFQFDLHDAIFILIPGKGIHLALGQLGGIGATMGNNKNNQGRVTADGEQLLSRQHELKKLILPHYNIIPPFPPNLLIPIILFGSQTKLQFAVGSVKGPDGEIAASPMPSLGIPMSCGDPVSMPALSITSGTVLLGFTAGDLVAGLALFATDLALDVVVGKALGAKLPSKAQKVVDKISFRGARRKVMKKFVEQVSKVAPDMVVQRVGETLIPLPFKTWAGKTVALSGKGFTQALTSKYVSNLVSQEARNQVGDLVGTPGTKLGDYVDGRSEKIGEGGQ